MTTADGGEPAPRGSPTEVPAGRSVAARSLTGHRWIPIVSVLGVAGGIAALLVLSLSSTSTSSTGASVSVGNSSLGRILVDRRGLTLYLYARDGPGRSVCASACARVWPPATISGKPTAAAGVSPAKLKTLRRPDNTAQLVYNGHPLYTFSEDSRGGQLGGEGFLAVWYAVSPAGRRVSKPGSASRPAAY
jgi:predicted lipoprotein with Yx(FWY)xxD motif